ncbi:MAG: hypothetical protein IKM24_04220, partial [Clostridia bacterium]|nr:hypothetical protein [Clostridia bacterium]
RQGFGKVALNLSQIDDNEYIIMDYEDGSFSYQLPFGINLKNSEKQLDPFASDHRSDRKPRFLFINYK